MKLVNEIAWLTDVETFLSIEKKTKILCYELFDEDSRE